jgi:periplasmic divalent cation tolerance protein
MITDCVMVWTTVGTGADVHGLASILVTERLAACVNVLSEMNSVYRWQGTVETSRERQLIIKTSTDRVTALKARLVELHEYDLPEFIVVPIVDGTERYLQWIRESAAG